MHTNKRQKMDELLNAEGMSSDDEYCQQSMMDSVVSGICMNDGCDYTTSVEQDSTSGWCEVCNTNSVSSGLRILGII